VDVLKCEGNVTYSIFFQLLQFVRQSQPLYSVPQGSRDKKIVVCKVYVSVRGHLKFWALGSLTITWLRQDAVVPRGKCYSGTMSRSLRMSILIRSSNTMELICCPCHLSFETFLDTFSIFLLK
jgi:hypothetical protein